MRELEDTWWSQWLVQAFPHLVPYKKWKSDHRNLQPNDIVHVLYDRKVAKGTYRLGRVLSVHADVHGVVRTVTVGLRRQDRRETALPYAPKALEEVTLGVQRVCVILPVEEQVGNLGIVGGGTAEKMTDIEEPTGNAAVADDDVRHETVAVEVVGDDAARDAIVVAEAIGDVTVAGDGTGGDGIIGAEAVGDAVGVDGDQRRG